jgi:transformation/transcription domain-associated protein
MDNDSNIINVFINRVIDPENPYGQSDSVRIFLLQLSSIFVQYAHEYIHDVNNKKHGQKLRRLMTYAWPCLLAKNCVDPFNKYHGHLVLSHLIAKFAIHKRIVFQVFHSLLKAYAPEAKVVVRNALEILTPSFPLKVDDGYTTLATWTKKILIEESHHVPQLAHMLYIIVKYHKVYYLIRHSLINHMINSFQKVGLPTNNAIDHKQLAIDLTEVILRWEAQRVKDTNEMHTESVEQLVAKHPDMLKPFEKHVADSVLNFFIKTSCPLSENGHGHSQNDQLSKRCLNLFKVAMLYDIWPNAEIKLEILERTFLILDSAANPQQQQTQQQPQTANATPNLSIVNYTSICTAIEIITFLIGLCFTRLGPLVPNLFIFRIT